MHVIIKSNGSSQIELPSNLKEGTYLLEIINLQCNDIDQLRKLYFQYVTLVKNHTGNDKQVLHQEFKEYANVASTTELTEFEQWHQLVEKFKYFAFIKFDLCL